MRRGPIRRVKDALAFRALVKPLKRWARETDVQIMDFWSGHKTKAGLAGAFLATLGGVFSQLASLDIPPDASNMAVVAAALPVLKQGFIALGGYGLAMKLLRWWEAKGEPKPTA